ncbi:MAG TPA: GNAT family N-acetyltransferase [Blastocatellia bacterium]|nr:GNAT family N-acetyltransferase [Blastocatellia bacterium]
MLPADVQIRTKLKAGDIGYLTYLHGVLYANEYGWDYTFEAYVAGPLAEFARFHTGRDRIWIVENNGTASGSIAIVEASTEQAQLRWFLLHPALRGKGIGRLLMEAAVNFCRAGGYSMIFLWTTSNLTAAARLYDSFGFHITEETTHEMWGAMVTEQRYELNL